MMGIKFFCRIIVAAAVVAVGFGANVSRAQDKKDTPRQGTEAEGAVKATKTKKPKAKKAKQAVSSEKEVDPLDDTSTTFDFDETLLEGKFKAPSGMVLKGRVQQSKSQMVQLRKNFRPDLDKSGAAVRTIRPRD